MADADPIRKTTPFTIYTFKLESPSIFASMSGISRKKFYHRLSSSWYFCFSPDDYKSTKGANPRGPQFRHWTMVLFVLVLLSAWSILMYDFDIQAMIV